MPNLVDHAHHGRGQLFRAVGAARRHDFAGLDAAQLLQKVDMEVGAAKLAVGDGRKADVLLHLHDLGDRAILDGAQLRRGHLAARLALPRLEQILGTQEAADVIGAKWGCRA